MGLGIFNKKKKPEPAYTGPPLDPNWARNRRGKFHRLLHLDPVVEGLRGVGGVYVIWHSGVKPEWVFVGRTDDMSGAIERANDQEEIMDYEKNGGLFVTWSPIFKNRQAGVVRYLHENLQPVVENPEAKSIKDGPIAVVPPKRRDAKDSVGGE